LLIQKLYFALIKPSLSYVGQPCWWAIVLSETLIITI